MPRFQNGHIWMQSYDYELTQSQVEDIVVPKFTALLKELEDARFRVNGFPNEPKLLAAEFPILVAASAGNAYASTMTNLISEVNIALRLFQDDIPLSPVDIADSIYAVLEYGDSLDIYEQAHPTDLDSVLCFAGDMSSGDPPDGVGYRAINLIRLLRLSKELKIQ